MNNTTLTRRNFLKAGGLLGLGLTTGMLVPSVGVSATEKSIGFSRQIQKSTRVELLMGTFVSMTVLHPSRDKGQEALGRAMEEMRRLAGMMTRFDPRGRISQLNISGTLDDVPPELRHVVEQGTQYNILSNGAFDMTIQPLMDVFKRRMAAGTSLDLDDAGVVQAMNLVDASALKITARGIHFEHEGMGVTLDGIAKGYIVDRGAHMLLSCGIENFLINAGGDIRVHGAPSPDRKWTVAMEDPEKKRRYPDVIHMSGGAVATSGGYEVYFDREKIHHHVIDPATGRSPLHVAGVSVVAPTAIQADAMSTAVFVMPVRQGLELIDSLPGHDCLIVSHSGRKVVSKHWESRV